MDKIKTLFRPFLGCVLPAILFACYLADVFLAIDPAEKVLPLFQKDLIKLIIFGLLLGTLIHHVTKHFEWTLFRFYPLIGIVGYFILNSLLDLFQGVRAGKSFDKILPEMTHNFTTSLFLGAGFGVLYWLLAVQKSAQFALFIIIVILLACLFYIKEILALFFI